MSAPLPSGQEALLSGILKLVGKRDTAHIANLQEAGGRLASLAPWREVALHSQLVHSSGRPLNVAIVRPGIARDFTEAIMTHLSRVVPLVLAVPPTVPDLIIWVTQAPSKGRVLFMTKSEKELYMACLEGEFPATGAGWASTAELHSAYSAGGKLPVKATVRPKMIVVAMQLGNGLPMGGYDTGAQFDRIGIPPCPMFYLPWEECRLGPRAIDLGTDGGHASFAAYEQLLKLATDEWGCEKRPSEDCVWSYSIIPASDTGLKEVPFFIDQFLNRFPPGRRLYPDDVERPMHTFVVLEHYDSLLDEHVGGELRRIMATRDIERTSFIICGVDVGPKWYSQMSHATEIKEVQAAVKLLEIEDDVEQITCVSLWRDATGPIPSEGLTEDDHSESRGGAGPKALSDIVSPLVGIGPGDAEFPDFEVEELQWA